MIDKAFLLTQFGVMSVLIIFCAIMWRHLERKRRREWLESVKRCDRLTRCQICGHMYDPWRSDAPELWRHEYCGDNCYRVWSMMIEFEKEGRLSK